MENLQPVFSPSDKIFLAVDCVILGFNGKKLQVLLSDRSERHEQEQFGLIYKIVSKDKNILDTAHEAVAGATHTNDFYLEQLKAFGRVDRDPETRVVSIIYYALVRFDDCDTEWMKKNRYIWHDIENIPELILDHSRMVHTAMEELKIRVKYKPIGQKLLPHEFTIPDFRALYEAIMEKPIDQRNFTRKIYKLKLVIRLTIKDRLNSKRGAYLHVFNEDKYEEYLRDGLNLDL